MDACMTNIFNFESQTFFRLLFLYWQVHAVLKFKKPCDNCVKNVKRWGKKMEGV